MRPFARSTLLMLAAILLLLPAPADRGGADESVKPGTDIVQHLRYTQKVPDSAVQFDMVAIPGGTFRMGSPAGEKGRSDDEGPQHQVRIAPFWMGKCEVTWDEYEQYEKEAGADSSEDNAVRVKKNADAITGPTPPYVDKYYDHGHVGHPAICISHHAAMEYCRWLSRKTGKTYRLPTEAEWEWAARAGTTTTYSFGNDSQDLKDYAWFVKNSATPQALDGTTHKVGSRKPNPWGLHDMYGNVAEWCLDHYQKDHYAELAKQKLALAPVLVPTDRRFSHVVRGGSWADTEARCRSSARRGSDKSWLKDDPCLPQSIWWLTRMDVIGFRVVRAVEEQDNLKGLRSKVTRESK